MICLFGHKWEGCKCKRCGKTRDDEHHWDGCKCKRCGKTRDEEHHWDGCKCTQCGKKHNFDKNNVCTICAARLVTETEAVEAYRECTGCPSGSGYGCTGSTATCIESDAYRTTEYITKTYILYTNGTKHLYR